MIDGQVSGDAQTRISSGLYCCGELKILVLRVLGLIVTSYRFEVSGILRALFFRLCFRKAVNVWRPPLCSLTMTCSLVTSCTVTTQVIINISAFEDGSRMCPHKLLTPEGVVSWMGSTLGACTLSGVALLMMRHCVL